MNHRIGLLVLARGCRRCPRSSPPQLVAIRVWRAPAQRVAVAPILALRRSIALAAGVFTDKSPTRPLVVNDGPAVDYMSVEVLRPRPAAS